MHDMNQTVLDILYKEKSIEITFTQRFDGLSAFKNIHDMMPPIGSIDRIVMNFSGCPDVETSELYYLVAELAADPLLDDVEIVIVGLRGRCMDKVPSLS